MTEKFLKKLIHESNLIEDIDDPREDKQSRIAWDWLHDWNMPLSHDAICKVQKIITLNQTDLLPNQRGYYRSLSKCDVAIGGRLAPSWSMVDGLMDNWLLDYGDPKKDFDPIQAHIRFEWCHPFRDGNGRTGRMILLWHQIKKGLEPTMFLNAEKHDNYYALFK